MFKEILQIIPKLSPQDLAAMERALGSRFGRIAKKFGKGLLGALLGGGLIGAAAGIIDKLLNPLKETQDAIDKLLSQGDDLVTNAKQFGTTAGKLFRLQQIAKSTGLDEGSLDILLTKFSTAVAEAAADPTKATSVRAFAGEKDTAAAFFEFIQSLQKMTKNQQLLVQQEVFGEKQILKMADFLQTDFGKQAKLIGGPTAEQLTPKLEKVANLNDLKDALEARRTLDDTFAKAKLVNEKMVKSQDAREKLDLERQQKQIKAYDNLQETTVAMSELVNTVKDLLISVNAFFVKLVDLPLVLKYWKSSRLLKGLLKITGGD